MPSNMRPPSRPSSTSPTSAPTTPTPTPTWPSSKSRGSATTTPSRISPRRCRFFPAIPRALYYRALVERNAGQVQEAIADLQAMLAKYPLAKDGLRELGFCYYQQHDYPKAREQYEKLQAIDPDDLAAHYQLAILYRRLGEKQKAAIESAKFADQKDDPTASTYALEFLRKHPEVASETVVWHTHDLTGDPIKPPAKIEYKYIPGAGF